MALTGCLLFEVGPARAAVIHGSFCIFEEPPRGGMSHELIPIRETGRAVGIVIDGGNLGAVDDFEHMHAFLVRNQSWQRLPEPLVQRTPEAS